MHHLSRLLFIVLFLIFTSAATAAPKITGKPVIIEPDLLEWPEDFPGVTPYLIF